MESSKVEKINSFNGLGSVHRHLEVVQGIQDSQILSLRDSELSESEAFNSIDTSHSKIEPLQSVSPVQHKPTNSETMMAKLAREISHLENWLEAHEASGRTRTTSLSNTIRSLIKTRRTLMENIEHSLLR